MTKYFDWKERIIEEELWFCADIIKNGGTVIFPTETVYGIGANALSSKAVQKIYKVKERAKDNPLIVHVSSKSVITDLAEDISGIEQKLIDTFMPGPFTLILKKKDIIPKEVSAGLDTVGIRMPINKIANRLLSKTKLPIAAPSANISGKPSGTRIEDIREELDNKVDAVIDGGFCDVGLESTVVKVINGIPTILRPGKVTLEEIRNKIGVGQISENVFRKVEAEEKVESPGMKYRHYAPNTRCMLIYEEDEEDQIKKINEAIKGHNACVLGFEEHKDKIMSSQFICLGSKDNLEEISKNIFTLLRKADKYQAEFIVIEGVKKENLGLAIMNRLERACEMI